MKKLMQRELIEIVEKHSLWLEGKEGGERADFSGQTLCNTDFKERNLSRANFSNASLEDCNFSNAILRECDFSNSTLIVVDFSHAELESANFVNTSLVDVSFKSANLKRANFYHSHVRPASSFILRYSSWFNRADLTEACLRSANFNLCRFEEANLLNVKINELSNFKYSNFIDAKNVPYIPMVCPEEGSFIGYKKARRKLGSTGIDNPYVIVKLQILDDAKRSSSTGRKCRCDKAKVLSITSLDGNENFKVAYSGFNSSFRYVVGEIVEEPNFDEDRWKECAPGIHFFMNRQGAVNYKL